MLWFIIASAWAKTELEFQQQKFYPIDEWSMAGYGIEGAGVGDFNGDGYRDFAVSGDHSAELIGSGAIYVYYGSSEGARTWIYDRLTSSDRIREDNFGRMITDAGDINGDGYDDLIVSALFWGETDNDKTGSAYVYYGSAIGLRAESEQKVMSPNPFPDEYFGASLAGSGDLNGDGYADVVVGTGHDTSDCHERGGAYVYYGSPSGLQVESSTPLLGSNTACGDRFAWALSLVEDLNGDGYDELLVGATEHDGNLGAAYLYYGSAAGLDLASEQQFERPGGSYFGGWVGEVGDLNGDGWREIAISSLGNGSEEFPINTTGETHIFFGGPAGPSLTGGAVLDASDPCYDSAYARSVAGVGDLDGDGYDEILVGAYTSCYGDRYPSVYLYYGSPDGPVLGSETQIHAFDVATSGGGFGRAIDALGDLDGDGVQEFLVSSLGAYEGVDLAGGTGEGIGAVYLHSLRRDADGDGIDAGRDCDDADATVGEAPPRYRDWDGDGFTSIGSWTGLCEDIPGFSLVSTGDCDDERASIYPGAPDPCEDGGYDSDCDGFPSVGTDDEDGDGLGWDAEHAIDTDVCDPDTDDDGVPDGQDPDPLGGPSDTAPPDTSAPDTSTPPALDEPRHGRKRGCAGCAAPGPGGLAPALLALLAARRRAR